MPTWENTFLWANWTAAMLQTDMKAEAWRLWLVTPVLRRQRQKGQDFQVTLCHRSWRPAWVTWDPVSKNKGKQNPLTLKGCVPLNGQALASRYKVWGPTPTITKQNKPTLWFWCPLTSPTSCVSLSHSHLPYVLVLFFFFYGRVNEDLLKRSDKTNKQKTPKTGKGSKVE